MATYLEQQHNPLWQSMLANYSRPLVAQTCLKLQQEQDVDVILLLFALYCAEQGLTLNMDVIVKADQQLSLLRERLILPLRQARLACKSLLGEGDVYQQLKTQELACEWQQCQRLWLWLDQQNEQKNLDIARSRRLERAIEQVAEFYGETAHSLSSSWQVLIEQTL